MEHWSSILELTKVSSIYSNELNLFRSLVFTLTLNSFLLTYFRKPEMILQHFKWLFTKTRFRIKSYIVAENTLSDEIYM